MSNEYPTIPIGKAKDLRGLQINHLTVLHRAPNETKRTGAFWWCRCKCGKIVKIRGDQILSGRAKSCGCYAKEIAIKTGKELSKKYSAINGRLNKKELTGQKFNHLLVLEDTGKRYKSGNGTSVIWKCLCDCGNICEVTSSHLISNHTCSCGCKKRSRGEEKIKELLEENKVPFVEEYSVKECSLSTGGSPRFDFFVNNSYFIEYDGEQHYECKYHGWHDEEGFKRTLIRDQEKNQWCLEHNIPLIRIPYTHLNDIKFEDLSILASKFIIN